MTFLFKYYINILATINKEHINSIFKEKICINIMLLNTIDKIIEQIRYPTGEAGSVPIKTLGESAYEPFAKSLRRGIPEMFFCPAACPPC
jgi:hypothetical protein